MTRNNFLFKVSDLDPSIQELFIDLLQQIADGIGKPHQFELLTDDFWFWYEENSPDALFYEILELQTMVMPIIDRLNPNRARLFEVAGVYVMEVIYEPTLSLSH